MVVRNRNARMHAYRPRMPSAATNKVFRISLIDMAFEH